jgi:hypothetical protein
MEKSESTKEIAAALSKFQAEVGAVGKDGTNPFFHSKYATLENVISTVKPVLATNGLSFSQLPQERGLYTLIMHISGEWIGAWSQLVMKDETPQGQGSALTYLRRYALSAALGLATEDDDDGNAATVAAKAKPVAYNKTPSGVVAPKTVADGRDVLKKRIKELVDGIVLEPLPQNGKAYNEYVLETTGFELVPDNYPSIIDALEGKQLENI